MDASLVAFTLQGITLQRGRERLGMSVRLRGTGMAIRRRAALAHPFGAPASEDLCLTLDLLLDGIRCRHVDRAQVRFEGASTWTAFGGQKLRYEAGRIAAARAYLPRLLSRGLRRRDKSCLEAAWFLATPPFALAALSLLAALALAAIAQAWPQAEVFGAGLLALMLVIVTGLIQARAGLRTWLALLVAPLVSRVEGRRSDARRRERAKREGLLPTHCAGLKRPLTTGWALGPAIAIVAPRPGRCQVPTLPRTTFVAADAADRCATEILTHLDRARR